MNEITLVGNLTADPVYRVAEQSGRGVVRFDIAVNRGASTGIQTTTSTCRLCITALWRSARWLTT